MASRKRKGRSFPVVIGGFFALMLVAAAVAVFIYFRYVRYERVAAQHLPADTTAAVRIDVEKVVLFEPVRKHLLPLVNELGRAEGGALGPRLERIQSQTGIELAVDMREIVAARGPSWDDWLVVVGGKFPTSGVVEGFEQVLAEEKLEWKRSVDGRALIGPAGISLGQASDGSLILASSERRLRSALPAQSTFQSLGLSQEGAAAFAMQGSLLKGLEGSTLAMMAPSIAELGSVRRATGQLTLGDPTSVAADVQLDPSRNAETAKPRFQALLGGLQTGSRLLPGPDLAGERAALERAELSVAGPHQIRVVFPWARADIDRGAARLAMAIRAWAGS